MTDPLAFLAGGGDAARMIRDRDWSDHPLGRPEGWPAELRAALSLVLNAPESMILAWGPGLHFFFNDTYVPLLGPRLPWAMGERFDRVWADAWSQAKPIVDAAMAGRAERFVDLPWTLDTDRGARDTWWTFSYSRVLDASGAVAGLFIVTNETTARVLGDRALRESEDHFRHTVELHPQVPWTADPQGNITSYSHRWLELTGQAPGEPLGAGWAKALHPDDLGPTMAVFSASLGSGDPVDVDYRIRIAATGEHRWMRARAHPRRDGAGAIIRWYGVVEDVHDRKLAEAALRESEARFRAFAQSVPNHLWSASPDGKLEWANAPTHAYSGRPADGILGDAWTDRVHPDDLPRVAARWASSLASGDVYETEFRVRRADGVYRWFLVRALPERGPDGAIVRWIGSNTDIEERRAAVEALERANATLEERVAERTAERDRAWRLSENLLAVTATDGTLEAVNAAWTRHLGWSEAKLVGTTFAGLTHPDDLEATLVAFAGILSAPLVEPYEYRLRHRDGTYRSFAWTAAFEAGRVYASGRDVTAEREREAALAKAEDQLRQSQKMEAVGQLTGGLAHDFNNLLAGISGSLEMVGTRLAQGRIADVERYMTVAQGAARRAAALTHRLLAFSRRQTLDPKPTDVNRLVDDMADMVRRTVGPAIHVEVVGASGLWPALVDPPQLENALLNLCINARDAMPDGGRITIETANRWLDDRGARERDLAPGQYLSLCVTDTGTGMGPDVIAKAFDPFFTTKPVGQGTGLGLSMIYGFARQSGGQARIYSEVGQGTTVCLYLPRHHGSVEEDAATATVALPRSEQGETVLVVDDEPSVRMLVTDILEDLGYTAIEAADSASGLKVLQSDVRIDLLVTDVGLPGGMNGRQMADAARIGRPDLKVLFVTGYAENAVVGNGQLEPGMAVMTKPFSVEAMAERVRAMIEA